MIKQYIVTDDLKLVDAKEVGIWKTLHHLVNQATQPTTDEDVVFCGLKSFATSFQLPDRAYTTKLTTEY